jgi:hypothetical protein
MTFDRDKKEVTKPVSNGDTISSDSIRFDFNASQKAPFRGQPPNPSSFQCSLDGSPFEDCVSPKSYGELPTEVGHTFQVRAIGILGNIDKSPHKFYFTTITSANIEGVIKRNGTPEVDAPIALHYNLTQITKSLEARSANSSASSRRPTIPRCCTSSTSSASATRRPAHPACSRRRSAGISSASIAGRRNSPPWARR